MNDVIPIFYAVDDKYSPFLSVTMKSLIENCDPSRKYHIHVIYETMSDENRERIMKLETDYAKIEFSEMTDKLEVIEDAIGNRLRAEIFTLTIYFRLFIPEMFPQYKKAIYIDSDTVVPGDIAQLYDIELGDNFFAACPDRSTTHNETLARYFEEYVGISRDRYINSGVLLLDLEKLRERRLADKFLELYNTYEFPLAAPDQDYLNFLCKDRILILEPEWNAMSESEEVVEEPRIIHYNLFKKPWRYTDVRYGDYFWKYAKETEYYDEILEMLRSYTDEEKREDDEHMKMMVDHAGVLTESETTPKKIFESGAEERL